MGPSSEIVPPEILHITAHLPLEQALRVVTELGTMQGLSVAHGRPFDVLADEIARRAREKAEGPDAEPWSQFAALFRRWATGSTD